MRLKYRGCLIVGISKHNLYPTCTGSRVDKDSCKIIKGIKYKL